METKYYVARVFGNGICPCIAEVFDCIEDAFTYARILSKQKKCDYIVLTEFNSVRPTE